MTPHPRRFSDIRLPKPPSLQAELRLHPKPCPRCGGSMVVCCGDEDEPGAAMHWLCLGCSRRKPYTGKERV